MVVIGKEKSEEYIKDIIEKHKKGILITEIYNAAIDRAASYISSIKFVCDYPNNELPQDLIAKTNEVLNDLEKILHNLSFSNNQFI